MSRGSGRRGFNWLMHNPFSFSRLLNLDWPFQARLASMKRLEEALDKLCWVSWPQKIATLPVKLLRLSVGGNLSFSWIWFVQPCYFMRFIMKNRSGSKIAIGYLVTASSLPSPANLMKFSLCGGLGTTNRNPSFLVPNTHQQYWCLEFSKSKWCYEDSRDFVNQLDFPICITALEDYM